MKRRTDSSTWYFGFTVLVILALTTGCDTMLDAANDLNDNAGVQEPAGDPSDDSSGEEIAPKSLINAVIHNDSESPNEAYKFYMSAHLAADDRYLVAFNAQEMRFFDLSGPEDARWIKDLYILWPGPRQPQAVASIGDHVYLVTTNGHLFVVDWTDRNDPVLLTEIAIQGGQNFDLATNGVDTLFVANTNNSSFQVIGVADPAQPEILYTDTVNGYGAGVAYHQGVAYATGFNGTLYAYEKIGETWQRTTALPDGVATLSGASRPAVIGDHLYVHRYGGNEFEIFSLANPAAPTPVGNLTTDRNVSTYARLVQSGDFMYVGLEAPNDAGESVIAYEVSNAGNPVRHQQLTTELAGALFSDDQIPWSQGGVMGMTVMPSSGLLSVISSASSGGAIRMITILDDPAF
jgi:hypothetical protein